MPQKTNPRPVITVEPELIPLDERHADLVELKTGFRPSTLVTMSASGEAGGIVRVRGAGHGRRFYLHVPSFERWAAMLPIATEPEVRG